MLAQRTVRTPPADVHRACSGTFSAPTAPRGRVCVYVGDISGVTNLAAWTWVDPTIARRAFYVSGSEAASSTFEFYATWAYTAP